MNLSSSQTIQSSNPLDTSSSRRVNNLSRPSAGSAEDDKQNQQLQSEEQRMLRELRARDREVRAHEAAHMAAGGSLVRGGPSYTYQRGPDGRAYAIGGEVKLDVSRVPGDPEATLEKAEQIRSAALAPADPSPQDLRVAANANQLAARARIDIAIQRREEASEKIEQNEQQSSSKVSQTGEQAEGESEASAIQTTVSEISSVASLATSEPPSAAISAFMATAETDPVPVRFNQFA